MGIKALDGEYQEVWRVWTEMEVGVPGEEREGGRRQESLGLDVWTWPERGNGLRSGWVRSQQDRQLRNPLS